ncbi:MAG: four helix bundle protein [Candidatus Moraniibacteriota bacterium]
MQDTPPKNFNSSQKNLPAIITREKEAYSFWVKLHKDFPRVERLGVGYKIEQTFLSVLEYTFIAAYQPPDQKIIVLCRTISKLDILKFFLQIAWESKLIHTEHYADLSEKLEEIGRMIGGWKKGLESKLLQKKQEKE